MGTSGARESGPQPYVPRAEQGATTLVFELLAGTAGPPTGRGGKGRTLGLRPPTEGVARALPWAPPLPSASAFPQTPRPLGSLRLSPPRGRTVFLRNTTRWPLEAVRRDTEAGSRKGAVPRAPWTRLSLHFVDGRRLRFYFI